MIAVGGMDRAIRSPRFLDQQIMVVEISGDGLDAHRFQSLGLFPIADEATHGITRRDQSMGYSATDEAGGTCYKDTHSEPLL
jgi:hypothetical protein